MELEELKDLMLEYLAMRELLDIARKRIDGIQEGLGRLVVRENWTKLWSIPASIGGAIVRERIVAEILTSAEDYAIVDGDKPAVFFNTGHIIETTSRENAEKIAEIFELMRKEWRKKMEEDEDLQKTLKVYRFLENRVKDLRARIYNWEEGAIPALAEVLEKVDSEISDEKVREECLKLLLKGMKR